MSARERKRVSLSPLNKTLLERSSTASPVIVESPAALLCCLQIIDNRCKLTGKACVLTE